MSEHTETRLPLIEKLVNLGWDKNQIVYQPEWKVPKTPSDASRREKGQNFQSYPIDVAIFDNPSNVGEYQHLQIIFETKTPTENAGLNQLEIYMSLEPYVLLGVWTNGTDISLLYRTADGKLDVVKNGRLPKPTDSLIKPAIKRLTWNDLETPTTAELKKTFYRLLNVVVSRDNLSTRRDEQLNNLCNVMLAKLER